MSMVETERRPETETLAALIGLAEEALEARAADESEGAEMVALHRETVRDAEAWLIALRAPAGGGSAGAEADNRFWLELREPRRVPERKGSWPMPMMAKILREVMAARPGAYITVVTVDEDGPHFDDGPQALQMADARSMSTGSRHMRSTDAAHAGLRALPTDTTPPGSPDADGGTEGRR